MSRQPKQRPEDTLGGKLRRLIDRAGIKQVELCRKPDISPSRLSNYLSGSREPDLTTLTRLAYALGVDLNHFAPIEPPARPPFVEVIA